MLQLLPITHWINPKQGLWGYVLSDPSLLHSQIKRCSPSSSWCSVKMILSLLQIIQILSCLMVFRPCCYHDMECYYQLFRDLAPDSLDFPLNVTFSETFLNQPKLGVPIQVILFSIFSLLFLDSISHKLKTIYFSYSLNWNASSMGNLKSDISIAKCFKSFNHIK